MKKLKKMKNKKGFTLIEIIVVLVIIAILAAVSVPALLGYVDEARVKAYSTDARTGMTAAQAVVTEAIASGKVISVDSNGDFNLIEDEDDWSGGENILGTEAFNKYVADVQGVSASGHPFKAVYVDNNRVTGIIYETPIGKFIKIYKGEMTVHDATDEPSFTDAASPSS